jgi:hypothetical protein
VLSSAGQESAAWPYAILQATLPAMRGLYAGSLVAHAVARRLILTGAPFCCATSCGEWLVAAGPELVSRQFHR